MAFACSFVCVVVLEVDASLPQFLLVLFERVCLHIYDMRQTDLRSYSLDIRKTASQ